tara:strand:+ start:255 stop:482 length:228 start_codon:yes stop_codon:yes gene_type:complete
MKEVKMQTNKNTLADAMFDNANMINNVSRTANLYGKLFALKDMQIYLLKEEKKIKDEIERCEGLEKLKERKKWKK